MAMVWTEDLAVGVAEIDNQHKELFQRINNLLEATSQRRGKEELDGVLKFLEDYVVVHFGTEEKFMTLHGYPEYHPHREQHGNFIMDLRNLKKQYATEGATSYLVIQVQSRVCDWLRNHIAKIDKALGSFLKDVRAF
ncbi:MAG: hemerythrin family protein [Armatimonadetes bacterium]|nr:hemerythrin family protein [Armatimonadota bacterium]